MPPRRRRRTGAREGRLSPEFQEALAKEAERLGAVGDSADVIRGVGDFFAQLDFELKAVADVRRDGVRQLRAQRPTYLRIAAATALSESRVAQIARSVGAGRGYAAVRRRT